MIFACQVIGSAYDIARPNGQVVTHGDSAQLPSGPAVLVRIDPLDGAVTMAGGTLPHRQGPPGRATITPPEIRFLWGGAAYRIGGPDETGVSPLHGKSRFALTDGPYKGDTMTTFVVGNCTRSTEAAFATASHSK
jgi:hypothetical protein